MPRVLAIVRLLPDAIQGDEAVRLSAVILDRLRERRIRAICGQAPLRRDAVDVFCDGIPTMLTEAVA